MPFSRMCSRRWDSTAPRMASSSSKKRVFVDGPTVSSGRQCCPIHDGSCGDVTMGLVCAATRRCHCSLTMQWANERRATRLEYNSNVLHLDPGQRVQEGNQHNKRNRRRPLISCCSLYYQGIQHYVMRALRSSRPLIEGAQVQTTTTTTTTSTMRLRRGG